MDAASDKNKGGEEEADAVRLVAIVTAYPGVVGGHGGDAAWKTAESVAEVPVRRIVQVSV